MPYTVNPTHIPDLLILEPKVFGDERGFFLKALNKPRARTCSLCKTSTDSVQIEHLI
jgi:dTDP-4-dehydrorhamnose 3,5-epimerase-like enzyme